MNDDTPTAPNADGSGATHGDATTEAPDGYQYGHVLGRSLRHLVACEPFNSTALCGTRVYHDGLTGLARGANHCPKCHKILSALGSKP